MSRTRKWIYITVLGVVGVTLFGLCVIKADARDESIQFYNDIADYEHLLAPSEHPLHIAYEAQAVPLMEAGVAKAYRTDFLSTIIIAVDRDQVKEEITGWSCLRNIDYNVYFGYKGRLSHIDFGYTILSMAAGLDYDDSGCNNTLQLLRYLQNNGRLLSENPSDAPVAILFDYQAARQVRDGWNIQIIVPSEGTLSFPVGIVSTHTDQLPDVSPEDLLAAGFRLPNGEADASIYPDGERYASAQNAVLTQKDAMQILNFITLFQRQVLGKRLLAPANGAENALAYLIFIILIVLWTGLLYMRISDKATQHKLFAISALLLFWMLIRIIRLILPDGWIDRLFWYMYYIPLSFLPAALFEVGRILNQRDKERYHGAIKRAISIISMLLALFVLTNDFHQMTFRFYRGTAGNNYDLYYSYGWVYYIVFAWSLFLIFGFVFIAVRRKTAPESKKAGPLFLLLCFSIVYFAGYALGIPVFKESEFSIVYGILSLLFLEVCFRSRLIPNNSRLGELLRNAPIDMHILSDAMKIEYKTNCAAKLPARIIEKARSIKSEPNTPVGFGLPDDKNTLYGVYRINGGYTVFIHHLDAVVKLHATLAEQNERIRVQNSILTRTHKVRSEIARLQAHQELFSRINGVLEGRVSRINAILVAYDSHPSNDAPQERLAKIKVLVNYCKRRGNLVLLEAGDEYCKTASLALWLQESIWEADAAGIDGLVTETGNARIHSTTASLIYDCFEHLLEKAMQYKSAVLLANLSVHEDSVDLRTAIETVPAAESAHFHFDQALRNALNALSASYRACRHDEGLKVQLSVPRGGRPND